MSLWCEITQDIFCKKNNTKVQFLRTLIHVLQSGVFATEIFGLVTIRVLFGSFPGGMQMLIRVAGKIIIKVHCLSNHSSCPANVTRLIACNRKWRTGFGNVFNFQKKLLFGDNVCQLNCSYGIWWALGLHIWPLCHR